MQKRIGYRRKMIKQKKAGIMEDHLTEIVIVVVILLVTITLYFLWGGKFIYYIKSLVGLKLN
jgi:hypothetical protein